MRMLVQGRNQLDEVRSEVPGRARLATKPDPTGSPTEVMTIGIVEVARRTAITVGVEDLENLDVLAFNMENYCRHPTLTTGVHFGLDDGDGFFNPASRAVAALRLSAYSLPSIGATCGGSLSRCGTCPLKPQCCPKEPSRKIPRDIHEHARDVARSFADTGALSSRGASARRSRCGLHT